MTVLRACLDCGAPSPWTRCADHRQAKQRVRTANRSTAIAIGFEGVTQPTREILIENNRFKNAGAYDTVFVTNRTATDAMLRGNQISGRAKALLGDGKVADAR